MLPASLLNVTEWPIASRGSCDVYEGLLNDSKVCVKRLRIYSAEGSKDAERVRYKHYHLSLLPLTKRVDLLSGGCSVETFGASKHRPPPGCHRCPLPIGFCLDGWRGIVTIHQYTSGCRPPRSRGFPPYCVRRGIYPYSSCLTLRTVSATSTLTA